ncbi:MAG: hypothetical protein NTY15_17760 [Planctomycetota bacterium]|nr:hypothetical protein [Planctomycetota bacterium]
MFSKIALVGVLGLAALVTSATAYMGMSPKGSCCQKSAMVAATGSCCAGQASCCLEDLTSVATAKSPCECAKCDCGNCLPEDCCCNNGTCCADGKCCEGGACCSDSAAKLVSTTEEACASGCCAKK